MEDKVGEGEGKKIIERKQAKNEGILTYSPVNK